MIYVFKEEIKTEMELNIISSICDSYNYRRNTILRTKEGTLLVNYDNKKYVLLRLLYQQEKIGTNFQYLPVKGYRNTSELWQSKILHFERKINDFRLEHEKINIAYYYLGLLENSLMIINNMDKSEEEVMYLQNERIKYPNYAINYLDQSKMIIDYKSRNLAEYWKSCFFESEDFDYNKMINTIKHSNFSKKEIMYFIARMFYPTYFFDYIYGKNDEKNRGIIKRVVEKQESYEKILSELLDYFNLQYDSIKILWIKKELNYNSTLITPFTEGTSSLIAS